MTSRLLLGVTFVVFIVVLGAAYFTLPKSTSTSAQYTAATSTSTTATSSSSTATTTSSGYTMAMVATHNSASSCWTAINGNVYDVTNWINQHPGGQAPILSLCGTDGSAAFNGQHGGQARPASELKSFLLGPLTQ